MKCVLDRSLVNADTVGDMDDVALTFFATLCSVNRGAFVYEGRTYGCTALPNDWNNLLTTSNATSIHNVNDISMGFKAGNVTASDTVDLLDALVQAVYESSESKNPYACGVQGLTKLECKKPHIDKIRAVSLTGVLTHVSWISQHRLSPKEVDSFLPQSDFDKMKDLKLNTVILPAHEDLFEKQDNEYSPILDTLVHRAHKAGLQVILQLQGDDNDAATAAATDYCVQHELLALQLPTAQSYRAARSSSASLPLLLPVSQDPAVLTAFDYATDDNVWAALDLGHTTGTANVASSSSMDDRNKLFYHAATTCILRSPIDYLSCQAPVIVSAGLDAASDDCALAGSDGFHDVGQCDRFNETVLSPWWHRTRVDWLQRQSATYEHASGYTYAAWKLYDNTADELEHPAQLLALSDLEAADLIDTHNPLACLNPPVADFALGDETVAPTAGPPPDCGNGWWNYSINNCTYWVPPATDAPTPFVADFDDEMDSPVTLAFLVLGVFIGLAVGLIWKAPHRKGYETIPSSTTV